MPRLVQCGGQAAALLAAEGPRVRGLVQSGGTVTPTTLLDELPNLGIISVFGVGYDGVPVDYCRQRGIMVAHTPDVLTDDVADVATALVLMTARGFVAADRFVRSGQWLSGAAPSSPPASAARGAACWASAASAGRSRGASRRWA